LIVLATAKLTVHQIDKENKIENKYLFSFRESVSSANMDQYLENLVSLFQLDTAGFGNAVTDTYKIGKFQGFAAVLSDRMLNKVLEDTDTIEHVEQDAVIHAYQACSTQTNAVWGLDRIAELDILLDGNVQYAYSSGEGVDAYIVDTGIYIAHNDFGGRALWGANYVDNYNYDCNGHGTHVAGTVGGTVYGVAKKSTLIAVKVLSCSGSGSYSGVVSGVNYVVSSYNTRKNPSLANMSLGGPISAILDNAVTNAIAAGVTFVVAAGNSNADACSSSPADVPNAITVGATGIDDDDGVEVDNRAYFSNYGKCTSIFAPGLMIQAPWINSPNATNIISGTSMASPHVAGAVAVFLGENFDASPAAVKAYVTAGATQGIVQLDCTGASNQRSCNLSPNAFLYNPCSL